MGEHLGTTLREHFSPSLELSHSAPPHPPDRDDLLSVVKHRDTPFATDTREISPAKERSECNERDLNRQSEAELEAERAVLRPLSYSNASVESASSPIMKMQPPSLRDFPVNSEQNPSHEFVHAPIRQRTDSRPTISPTNTSRAISTPAPMPLPQALQDMRPSIRRAQGQRAESEVVRSRSSSKPFSFPARSSAQYASQERPNMLQTKPFQPKNGGSFIRRLIRRASLRGNKSQSMGGTPSWFPSPSKTSVALPSQSDLQKLSTPTTPRAESFSLRATKDSKPQNSLTRRRSKSKDAGSSKASKTSSIFAPFLARDPNKSSSGFRTHRAESFGHTGPLPLDDAPPLPRDGLPPSSSSPFLARDPGLAGFTGASDEVRSHDFAIVKITRQGSHASPEHQETAELLKSPQMRQAEELDSTAEASEKNRPLSHMTDGTDNSIGMGMPTPSRSKFNFQDSYGLNELSSVARQRSDTSDLDDNSISQNQTWASSNGHSSALEGHARPRASVPRIWQGLEPIDGDSTMRSTHIDDADESDDASPDNNVPANRFDTVTTTSSFRTAMSNLDSPKSVSNRRQNNGSRASRVSLRTLDTPLARHFDQGTRQDSPLADLITSLEGRTSFPSTSGTMGSAPFLGATASPSSEFRYLESEEAHPAIAAGPTPSPSVDDHGMERYQPELLDEDDDASIRALPLATHLSTVSHTALVETISHSNRNSPVGRASNGEHHCQRRDTFGGLDSILSQQSEPAAEVSRTQLSRFSTATEGPHTEERLADDAEGDVSEAQEIVSPEVKVCEIESHLAAVEAALQHNRDEGSFDPTSLRQRMSDASYVLHANTSSASVLSRDGSLQPTPRIADKSTDDLPLPGAWAQDSSSFIMSDDGRRITLAPESHEALADAVRSVRKAISSSQLTEGDESRTAIANGSVDTLGENSFVSEHVEPNSERMPAGEMSIMSEATPAKAAKRRQEGMRDIEEAYGRMLALVHSSAIGVTPSPQMRAEESRLEPPRRPMKHGQSTSGGTEPVFNSPLAKASTKTDEPLSQHAQAKRNTQDGTNHSQAPRSQLRTQSMGETRASTSLSGLMGMPLDIKPQMLRHASVSSASSAQDISRNESIEGVPVRRRPPSDAKSSSSRYSQALSRDHVPSSLLESDSYRKRFSTDNTTVGRASSGNGHTSPSATAKTLGTPRSFATSVSQHSLANMVRRHELEKESLLDTLERVRAENADLHSRHESLTGDLHAEVTRVLELERELERRDSREVTLIGQIQDLENELMELRYLDHQLNSTADQTLGSEDGEGSIMDVELPPALHSNVRPGGSAFSPRIKAGLVSPPPSFSSSVSALAKPTHRVSRSEAFVSGLPGSERSILPASSSELPRARPVSLLNGPGGLFREDSGSVRSSQASPLPTPRSSSLLRAPRYKRTQQTSPALLGGSLPKEEDEMWSIADEELPEVDYELVTTSTGRSHQRKEGSTTQGETIDSRLGDIGHRYSSYEQEGDRYCSVPSTVQNQTAISSNAGTPQRDVSSSLPRSGSQATVTKNAGIHRPFPAPSKIPTSRSVSGGISDSPSHRSISSRLPRLGIKPSTQTTTSSGIRSISGATDKSIGSTLSSVYSNISVGAPPSLGSLPSGNNTMEDEIQAELARMGNPQPYLRYYSPPRSKMI
nr:putative protein [Melanopsichium pennsylvanicum 4]